MQNEDTQRKVDQIRARQWYRSSETMGWGGWQAVAGFAADWKTYVFQLDDEVERIIAANDAVAWEAANTLYRVTDAFTIAEVVTTYRLI